MQPKIHPKYEHVNVVCNCGNRFEIRSTVGKKDLHVEICSNCHPFYTGQQKVVDTAGMIQKFHDKFAKRGKKKG